MKTPLFMLTAAACSLVAGAAAAATAPSVLEAFVTDAQAQAEARFAAAAVDRDARSGVVQAYIGADGRLKGVRVVSAESPCAGDRDVQRAVHAMRFDDVPPELIDARLTIVLGPAKATLAKLP